MRKNLFSLLDDISRNDIHVDVLLATNKWICNVKVQNLTPQSAVLIADKTQGHTTYYLTPMHQIVTVRYEL